MTWYIAAYFSGHSLRELEIDVIEYIDIRPVDHRILAVAQLEGNGVSKMNLLIRSERVEEKLGMAKVLFEFIAARPLFNSLETLRIPDTLSVDL